MGLRKIQKILLLITGILILVYFQNCAKLKTSDISLDSAFNSHFGSGFDGQVLALARQNDGKILVGGEFGTYNGIGVWPSEGLVRLNPDGSLDSSFRVPAVGFHISGVSGIFIQHDGKILVNGGIYIDSVGDNPGLVGVQSCLMVRLNPDGSIDPTFLCSTTIAINTQGMNYITMVEQPDGKIVFIGAYITFDQTGTILSNKKGIFRLNTNGTIDTSFHSYYIGDNSTYSVSLYGLAQDSSGRLLVAGSNVSDTTLNGLFVRLLPNGDLDTSFQATAAFQIAQAVTIQSDGKIIVGGANIPYDGKFVARYNANGTLDTAFNNNILADNLSHLSQKITVQNDGKIILLGMQTSPTPPAGPPGGITRLKSDGTRDLSFDQAAGSGLDGSQMYTPSCIILPNENILVGGSFSTYNGTPAHNILLLNPQGGILQ
jgi:uncharacterized delta-60 repeat protein